MIAVEAEAPVRDDRHSLHAGCKPLSVALVLALGLLAGGCSVSMPIASLFGGEERTVTGSIQPTQLSPLSPELGVEDWRRAKGALALALDPIGNGQAVSWENPDTRMRGTFTPVGLPFVKSDEICRAFLASLNLQGQPSELQGTACRPTGEEWKIQDIKPWKPS